LGADFSIATAGRDREFVCGHCPHFKKHRKRQCGCIEGGAEVRGSRWQNNLEGLWWFGPRFGSAISHTQSQTLQATSLQL
jgi:hypothetical protein